MCFSFLPSSVPFISMEEPMQITLDNNVCLTQILVLSGVERVAVQVKIRDSGYIKIVGAGP